MNANPSALAPTIDERMNQLEQQMAEILKLLKPATRSNDPAPPEAKTDRSCIPEQIAAFVSRRAMLKKAALATLGAAAVLETMPSAKAGGTNGNALILGESNVATATTTVISNSGSYTGLAGSSFSGYGLSGSGGAAGVYGNSSDNYGVYGYSYQGIGVHGASANGGTGIGVAGSSETNIGVRGVSTNADGVVGMGGNYGASLEGGLAPLALAPNSLASPYQDTQAHIAGELFVDSSNGLWYCVTSGTPGTWNRLAVSAPAESATAGNFNVLSAPTRFIDTRPASASYTGQPAPGPGQTTAYGFSGNGADIPYTPSGSTAPVIPFGATALTGRITVVSGQNGSSVGGILKVSNVYPPGFGSGLITWGTTPATQIAAFVLSVNNSGQPVAGGGTIFFENTSVSDEIGLIVDVTGYYY